jgi:2,4-dienoyl-CoA reductase-like NADH-dependent reductase (Old Yellow Enzyme family)
MSLLLSPLTIRSITLKNRVVISPMCQYSSEDGFANDWHMVHLGSRAVGGAALVMQEATAVSAEGRITTGDAGIYTDEHISKWQAIVKFIHAQGAVAGIQLAHAGRKSSSALPWLGGKQIRSDQGGWLASAPSAIAYHEGDEAPSALDAAGIKQVVNDFRDAAARAHRAGYRVIELHAAHGYLVHEFLSPLSNARTDEYGGSFENRVRLLREIITAVRTVWPAELPLFVRISATDWAEGGWNETESVKLAGIIKDEGVDLIDCSSGGLVPKVKIPVGPGYQVPFAAQVKKEAGIMTGAVGLITTAEQAEEILRAAQADLVFIARQSLRDPYFPMHAAKELNDEIKWPLQYERAG